MKKFTLSKLSNLSLCLALITTLLMSSCSTPQHFSFSPAPAAYTKKKVEPVAPVAAVTPVAAETPVAPAAPAPTFTASTAEAPVVLPEIAKAAEVATAPKAVVAKQKLNLAQKVVLKKLEKQVQKIDQKTKKLQDTAAGPVNNRTAIALILIGLVIALFGALLGGLFYTLGTLVILIGLVLLILNYI